MAGLSHEVQFSAWSCCVIVGACLPSLICVFVPGRLEASSLPDAIREVKLVKHAPADAAGPSAGLQFVLCNKPANCQL